MQNPNSHIRKTIKILLAQKGISAEKLAYECGVSKGFLYGYLAGNSKNISVDILNKIASGLEVPLRSLFPLD